MHRRQWIKQVHARNGSIFAVNVSHQASHREKLCVIQSCQEAADCSLRIYLLSGSSATSNLDSHHDDFLSPKPLVGNNEGMNEWLKKDLINKEKYNQTYKQMSVRSRFTFFKLFVSFHISYCTILAFYKSCKLYV
jgi:hypothetical protein